jgi:DNA-binding NarL/FixJ family response regulator
MSATTSARARVARPSLPGRAELRQGFALYEEKVTEGSRTKATEITVRIAHSDPVISAGLTALLEPLADFNVLGPASQLPGDRDASPHVVIADYDSGVQLTATASRSLGRVVILSDSDSQAKICRAFALGARGYLLSGCSLEDLVTGIRSVHAGGVAVTPRVARRIADSLNQESLTTKEQSVLRHMAFGQSNKKIAHQFGLAEGTVKTHVKSILRKLNAGSRGEAVAYARGRGILPEELEIAGQWRAAGEPRST